MSRILAWEKIRFYYASVDDVKNLKKEIISVCFSHRIISVCAPQQEIESTLSGSSFAGLFILLRGLAFCTEKAFSDHLFGNIFYIHAGALQIEQSEESDQGKYECVATNSAGTRYSAPANLYVRGRNDVTVASRVHSGSGNLDIHRVCVIMSAFNQLMC